MSGRVAEIKDLINPHSLAVYLIDKYTSQYSQISSWREEKKELRNFLFATDTRKTSVDDNTSWKNSTTLPKLCQLRDNLHANYKSALFPNDDWLHWEGFEADSDTEAKRKAILAYMKVKLRESEFMNVVDQLLYDYIDYGMVIADSEFVKDFKTDPITGEVIPGYNGPMARRHSPLDTLFNPTATSFKKAYKFSRYIKTLGELKLEMAKDPSKGYNQAIIDHIEGVRQNVTGFSTPDVDKAAGYLVDGFGSMLEYYQSGYVEIIEFEGDVADENGNLLEDHIITIIDRSHIVRKEQDPSWFADNSKVYVAWRNRPDNLLGMGPLDNLIGLQYRIDHLENAKADAFDLAIHPPLKIKGNVESFSWGPGETIFLGDDGEVEELGMNLNAIITAQSEIAQLEQKMEEYAGAPKQAMGIRTPGEKTAFEVQQLENNASRIFQAKIAKFEMQIVEPLVNNMLEQARRNLDGEDIVRVLEDDAGLVEFIKITKSDIIGKGKLRPVGARHFAATAQLVQNLNGVFSSPMYETIAPHVSSIKLAKLIEEVFGLERFGLVRENVAIAEQAQTQSLMNEAQQGIDVDSITPIEEEDDALI